MTDLELADKWCDECLDFINPFLYRQVRDRGIAWAVDRLPRNKDEAKAVVRARFAKAGKFFGDAEIDQIAGEIDLLKKQLKQLNETNITDAHLIAPILEKMKETNDFILNYFR